MLCRTFRMFGRGRKRIVHEVVSEDKVIVCHHSLCAVACKCCLSQLFFFFLRNLGHFEKTRCITHRFLCCDASVCSRIYTEPSHCDPSQTLFPASCLPPGVSGTLTVTTREAPLGSALCKPVSVSDRVAPHAYISLKSEHTACSVFSLSTELETPPHPLHPRPHCRSRTLYLYTATSSLC